MGIFRFGNYAGEGKGVDKNAPKKRGLFAFFELFFRKIGRLCLLNAMYLVATIPVIVVVFLISGLISTPILNFLSPTLANILGMTAPDMTNENFMWYLGIIDLAVRAFTCLLFIVFWGAGPVTAGYTYVLRNYADEKHSWFWSDFWQYAKENFKQALVVLIVDIVAFVLMFYAYIFYDMMGGMMSLLKYFVVMAIIIYSMAHFYIYQIMITFKLKLKDVYKNAFLFVLLKLPSNLMMFALIILIHAVIPWLGLKITWLSATPIFWIVFVVLESLILVSLTEFLINFFVLPKIKEYMIETINVENEQ